MKKLYLLLTSLLFVFYVIDCFADTTLEKAQHRIPPVIYSLDIPKAMESEKTYEFRFSVMGYHDMYKMKVSIFDDNYNDLKSKTISPYDQKQGQYKWNSVYSTEYFYKTNIQVKIDKSQPLIVRFFASPTNDPIDQAYLSCLVPGGLGYAASDTTGRKVKILGLARPYKSSSPSDYVDFNFSVISDDPYCAVILLQIQSEAPVQIPQGIPFSSFMNNSNDLTIPHITLALNNSDAKINSVSLIQDQNEIDPVAKLFIAIASDITSMQERIIGIAKSFIEISSLIYEAISSGKQPQYAMFSGGGTNRIINYLIHVQKNNFLDKSLWDMDLVVTDQNGIIQLHYEGFPLIEKTNITTFKTINR